MDFPGRGEVSARLTVAWLLAALTAWTASFAGAQALDVLRMSREERAAYFAGINVQSEQSWRRMVGLLHLALPASLPPPSEDTSRPRNTFQKSGSSNWYDSAGNLYTRSAWGTWNNYDEAKANPYPNLPDPLRLPDGSRLKDADIWWRDQRLRIEGAFTAEIFGRVPLHTPAVTWRIVDSRDTTMGADAAVIRTLRGHVDNSRDTGIQVDIQLTLTLPAKASRPVPVIMEFGFLLPPGFTFPGMPSTKGRGWEERVLSRGWGCAVYVPASVQPDNAAGLTGGIIGLMNRGQPPSPDDWGALRAWAWGASRVMDFFETDPSVDAKKIGIEGVSRYGKAVLVTMAYDQRFAIALVGSSGKGGATLYRRNYGESMGNICSPAEYHWFAGNFLAYASDPDRLTVDSHELIALCAPRPVFISCGSPEVEGRWVDDMGQFTALMEAGPVYKLLGDKGLKRQTMPDIGTFLVSGALAFRQHQDGHTIGPNWPYFLDFAEKFLGAHR